MADKGLRTRFKAPALAPGHIPPWLKQTALLTVNSDTLRPGGLTLTRRAAEFCNFTPGNRILDVGCGNARWLAFLGDWAYAAALSVNTYLNVVRRWLGFSYWSLSAWAKVRVKNAVNFIGAFEEALAREARAHDVHGVICGHIHYAAMHDDFGIAYHNCGDWVESCTALAEDHDGRFEIIRWADGAAQRHSPPTQSEPEPVAA